MKSVPALVAAVVFLSGCVSGGGDDGLVMPAEAGRSGEENLGNLTAFRHALDGPVHNEAWANGTAASCTTSVALCSSGETFDLSHLFPPRTPARLVVGLRYEADPVLPFAPVFTLGLFTGDAVVYDYRFSAPEEGYQTLTATLTKGIEAVRLDLFITNVDTQEIDYALGIWVDADPERTPGRVPVGLHLEPGTELHLEVPMPSVSAFTIGLYDPFDELAARIVARGNSTTFEVPQEAAGGEYVALLLEPELDVRIQAANLTTTLLRPLPLRVEYLMGAANQPLYRTPVEWTFDLERTPLALGLYVRISGTIPMVPHPAARAQVMDARGEPILDGPLGCDGCLGYGFLGYFEYTLFTDLSDPRLKLGSFTARYDPEGAEYAEVGSVSLLYAR